MEMIDNFVVDKIELNPSKASDVRKKKSDFRNKVHVRDGRLSLAF